MVVWTSEVNWENEGTFLIQLIVWNKRREAEGNAKKPFNKPINNLNIVAFLSYNIIMLLGNEANSLPDSQIKF